MDTSNVQLVNVVVMTMSFLFFRDVYCQQTPAANTDDYERVQVISNSSNNTPTPSNLRVTFQFGSCNVSLSLQLNPNVSPNAALFVGINGIPKRSTTSNSEMFAYYIDPSTDASVLVKAERESSGYFSQTFTGVFKCGNDTYSIEPVPPTTTERRRRRRRRRGLRRMERDTSATSDLHLVRKDHTQLDATSPSLTLPRQLLQPPTAERIDPDPSGSNSVDKPPERPNYVVELMVFIDYRIYSKMYDLSTATASYKGNDTLNRIQQYFGHIINGVDLRYRSINDSSFSINVHLVGFYVATDANSSAFVEKNRVGSGSSAYLAAQQVTYDFADWVNVIKGLSLHEDRLLDFDQASLFTSEYLNGANGDRISGLAFYRSMCTYYSVLLVRDSGEYGSSETAAHELGHNLGAGHDGIDNTCSAADQHIMVASTGPLTDAVYKNAYTFSTCSIDELKSFLLSLLPGNCLQKISSNSTDLTGTFQIPLGTLYRPDEQCAMLYGNGSFYCGGEVADQQICRSMGCYHPVWQYCVTPYEQRAFSGTQCGNQKWCFMGDCVYDPRAPTLDGPEDCMYGDSKAPFYDGFRCSNVSSQPWNCYKSTVAEPCCGSCRAIRNNNLRVIGCEYGDQFPGCQNYNPIDCSDPSISSGCCRTCSDLQTRDCASGDRISGCSETDCLDATKYNDCCGTCASLSHQLPSSTTTLISTTQTTTSTTTPTVTSATTTTSTTTPTTTTTRTTSTTTQTTTPTTTTTTPTTTTTTPTTTTTTPTTTKTTPTTTTTIPTTLPQLSPSCTDYDFVWCRNPKNFPPSNCYTSNMVYCCAFCFSIRDYSRPGCEYGDRYTWCNTSPCSNDDERKSCCGTCKDYLTSSTTTSTTTRTTTTPTTTPTTRTTTTTTPTTTTSTTTTPTTTTTTPTTTTTTPTTTTTTPTTTTATTTSTTRTTPSTTTSTTTTTTTTTPMLPTTTSAGLITLKVTPTVGRLTENPITSTTSLKQTSTDQSCRDVSSVCKNMDPMQCYADLTRMMCCNSCRIYNKGPPGCEYGDRYMLCVRVSPADCSMYREECCRTCQGL